MTVAEKIRYLRVLEGHLRGLGRDMSQKQVVDGIRAELRHSISQPYLSQLESGRRKHLTNTTRLLLAKFFRVHPGFLVDDPEGFQTGLATHLEREEENLDLWLIRGAERFREDAPVSHALLKIAQHEDSRCCLQLLALVLETPQLVSRLWEALHPAGALPSAGALNNGGAA